MKLPFITILSILPLIAALSSCKEKGPAEKAGEKLDDAVEEIEDTVNPKGPVEKAGEKVDEALEN
ncbi:MAG: hypothetical protein H7Y36_03190 [Armatimonadetes bacterium]|nr:hypothetical protein [Akkermansiaceae bacterium]